MRFLVVLLLVTLSGCGLLYDFDPADDAGGNAGFDAGPRDTGVRPIDAARPFDASPCSARDGAQCSGDDGPYRICLDGLCVPSVCGDLFIDVNLGETCELDDPLCVGCGLEACECPDILLPCREPVCSGTECLFAPLPTGSTCVTANDSSGECADGVCRLRTCGDGTVDIGEQCDDSNNAGNDGCESDCTFTCTTSEDCDDFDACNGIEVCSDAPDPGARTCGPSLGPPTVEACEVCDPDLGVHKPDADGDGFARDLGQPCPEALLDCDDGDPLIHPGADEVCDGDDNDCDSSTPDSITLECGIDADADGWPAASEVIDVGCGAFCPAGTAPVRSLGGVPVLDCDDGDARVHPTQPAFFTAPRACTVGTAGCADAFDYNCDGAGEREDTRVEHCTLLDLTCESGAGWVGSVPACGNAGRFANCVIALVCVPSPRNRTQGCR